MTVKSSKSVQALQARAGSQMIGEGLESNLSRSLVIRSMSARLRTVGVLHIVAQKVTEQLVTHINVTYIIWIR